MKKLALGCLILAVIIIFVVLMIRINIGNEDKEKTYKTVEVKRGRLKASVSSTGRLNPLNTVVVGSQVSGIVKDIYVDFNDLVAKDQVIGIIDPAIYVAQVEQTRAQLLRARMQLVEKKKDIAATRAGIESAEAQLKSSLAVLKEAEINFKRVESLAYEGVVTRAEFDSALAKRDNALGAAEMARAREKVSRAQLESAEAQENGIKALIAEREAELRLAETRLGYCTIKSPIKGVIISREVDVGQTVAATLQSPVLFTIAEDLTFMQVEVDVSEADVGQISPGQEVEFTVDAFPDKKFKANVRQVRNFATSIQNVVTYKIIADVKNDSLILRPGMTANVTIIVANLDGVLKVPNAALRFKPPGDIKEEKMSERPSTKESELYKKIVKQVDLDEQQATELVKIIDAAGVKLKTIYALPEEDRDTEQAWHDFFKQIFTSLYKVLREDQYGKFKIFIEEFKEAAENRKIKRGRPARVYILDADGFPKALRIAAGITDEAETQVVQGNLKEGDRVIVGMEMSPGKSDRSSGDIFSSMFGRK